MMIRFFLFTVWLCCCTIIHGQEDTSFILKASLKADIKDFSVDNLGNLYVLNADNQLKKIGPTGDSLAVYNDVRRYGKLFSVDPTNPLKILLYYREFATILEVDRFLNTRGTIDLRNLNIFQAKAVGLAYNNNIWVYDELEARLKQIADDGSLVDQTSDLRQVFDTLPDPTAIIDQGDYVYLFDPGKGVYVFDHYGGFKNHIAFHGLMDFNVIDKSMLARDNQFFYKYQSGITGLQRQAIPTSYTGATKIMIMPASIYVLKPMLLEIYVHR